MGVGICGSAHPAQATRKAQDMQVGSKEYQATLRRWTHLASMTVRTWEQQQEMERLNRALDAAEAQHVKANVFALVASDYADLGETGHLGGVEL